MFKLVGAGVFLVVILQIDQVMAGPSTALFRIAASDLSSAHAAHDRLPAGQAAGVDDRLHRRRIRPGPCLWGPARGRGVGWGIVAVAITGVS